MSEDAEAVTEPSVAEATTESQREPYGLCKRFLRGYPILGDWFPKCLGPPREDGPALNGDAAAETSRAGERAVEAAMSHRLLPGEHRLAPGIRRRFRFRSTKVIP